MLSDGVDVELKVLRCGMPIVKEITDVRKEINESRKENLRKGME